MPAVPVVAAFVANYGAAIGAAAAVAGTAYSAARTAHAEKEAAKTAKEQARVAREAAEYEAGNIREAGRRMVAAQRAALAGSGVKINEGTGDALQAETFRLAERDALAVLKGGQNTSRLLNAEASAARGRATAAVVGGALDAASTGAKALSKTGTEPKPKVAPTAQPAKVTQLDLDSSSQALARRTSARNALLSGGGGGAYSSVV